MKPARLHVPILLVCTLLLVSAASGGASSFARSAPGPATQAQVEAALHRAPVMFVENVGQFAEGARFRVYGGDRDLWLADDGLWITVWEPVPVGDPAQARGSRDVGLQESQPRRGVGSVPSYCG